MYWGWRTGRMLKCHKTGSSTGMRVSSLPLLLFLLLLLLLPPPPFLLVLASSSFPPPPPLPSLLLFLPSSSSFPRPSLVVVVVLLLLFPSSSFSFSQTRQLQPVAVVLWSTYGHIFSKNRGTFRDCFCFYAMYMADTQTKSGLLSMPCMYIPQCLDMQF